MPTKLLVCGGRNYNDYDKLEDEIHKIERACGDLIIISGCAKGADTLAIQYAENYGDPILRFPADWNKNGKAAGPIRNQQMLDEGQPDLVLAFSGGSGTADMIRRAEKAGIEVIKVVN